MLCSVPCQILVSDCSNQDPGSEIQVLESKILESEIRVPRCRIYGKSDRTKVEALPPVIISLSAESPPPLNCAPPQLRTRTAATHTTTL